LSAVGGGKSVWLCAEGIQLSLDYPKNRGYLCRQKLTDFRISTLLELKKYMDATIIVDDRGKQEIVSLIEQHHQTENYFRLYNGSVIYYGGIGDDKDGTTRVKNMTLGWVGCDQLEEVAQTNWNWLLSRLRLQLPNIHYKALATANPTPGWVKHTWLEQQLENHIFVPALPKDNPYLPPDYESNLRKWFPPEMVKALLDGDWDALEGGNFLFRYNDLRNATKRDIDVKEDDVLWAGIDVAREGEDSSVFTVRQGNKVIYMDSWGKTDLMETTGIIGKKIEKFKIEPKHVNLDAVGVGAGVYDRLRELKLYVNGIIAGGEPDDKEHYVDTRAEMYDSLRNKFEQGTIKIDDEPDLIAQLSSIRFKIQSDKKLRIVSKEDMKKQYRVKSPDKADSLALCFYEAQIKNPQIRWL